MIRLCFEKLMFQHRESIIGSKCEYGETNSYGIGISVAPARGVGGKSVVEVW